MNDKKPRRWRKRIAVGLLALACVGGAELAVCRFAAPELFQTITQPVTNFANDMAQAGRKLFARPAEPAPPEEKEEPVEQLAGAPEIDERPPAQDPVITEFIQKDGQEILTGGVVDMVYFNQGEEPWASMPFGPDPIGGYGCGPTAMSMVVSSLTGELVDPGQMAAWAAQNGYCAPGSGSYLNIVEGTAAAYGLEVSSWPAGTADELCRELAAGKLFVALMTKGHFTSSGHFIVLRGVTLEGEVLVADPNSRERSLAAWDPQLILDELSPSRYAGAPLWEFSTIPLS